MPWAYQNPMLGNLTILQGTASVRAPAVENIYMIIDFNNTYEAPKDLAHLYLTRNEITFPDKNSPFRHSMVQPPHRDAFPGKSIGGGCDSNCNTKA
jgi:hypothetical protein